MLPASKPDDSSRHQVLVVTNDPKHLHQVVMKQEASISNMSNPLNQFQLSHDDNREAIKIKSIMFDKDGKHVIHEAVRGTSLIELGNSSHSPKQKKASGKTT